MEKIPLLREIDLEAYKEVSKDVFYERTGDLNDMGDPRIEFYNAGMDYLCKRFCEYVAKYRSGRIVGMIYSDSHCSLPSRYFLRA